MKQLGKKIAILLLMALSLNIGFNGTVIATVQAAGMTQQQKAREAEKKQREKEAAKRKKEQQKAKEKAAKQREKEKAARQKAKDKAAKQRAKEQAKTAPKLTREEEYQMKLAEAQKYNAYVARYMSRDITHRVGLWGQVGYSNLLPNNFQYQAASMTGFDISSKGGVGGGVGVGYQLRYKRLLVTTGLEMQIYTSLYQYATSEQGLVTRSFDMRPYEGVMQYTYRFTDAQEKLTAGFLQIPVLAGMEFANRKAYFLAGPKIGIGIMGTGKSSANLSTSIYDQEAIDPYQNIPSHLLVTDMPLSATSSLKWNMNLALYGEIGMSLDPWIPTSLVSVRLAAFAEYGVLNIQSSSNIAGSNDQPVDYSRVLNSGHPVQDVALVSSLTTTTAADAKVNPLMVGIKATCWFNLPRKALRTKPLPKEPLPTLLAQVVHADNSQPLSGSSVTLATADKTPVSKTTNAKGIISARLPKGDYTISATKVGYYDDSLNYTLDRDMRDTLRIRLRPEPKPIVYTLAGRVFAAENRHELEAEVQIMDMNARSLYKGTTSEDGMFVTHLLAGQYVAQLRCPGYMPLDDTIQFLQDTLAFYMTKIKEGKKVKINNLYFATNRTYILPQSEPALQDLAQFLSDNAQVRIRIIGHTDNVGSEQANQVLSEGRANSLRIELIKRGVDAARIETEGRGEREPIDTNDTEEGRQNNRRVEFMILSSGDANVQQIK